MDSISIFKKLKVIELASVLAGPDVGMFFAELGAEVIKIENKRTKGDVTRTWRIPGESEGQSAYFSSVNYNKKHLFLDISQQDNLQTLEDHLKEADILITNFKPGDAEKFGLSHEALLKKYPKLIHGAITGYGRQSKRTAYDVVLQAETGFMSMNGTNESGPIKMPVALIDVLAAHQLKEGILIALLQKQQTQKGAYVEVSLYDAAISSLKNQASNYLMEQHIPKRIGSLHPNIAPYGETFLTKDKKSIVLAIGSNKHFQLLLQLLNIELDNPEVYKTNQLRVYNRKSLQKQLAPYFKKIDRAPLLEKCISLNIPLGGIYSLDEVFKNPMTTPLVIKETVKGKETKRVKTVIFTITSNKILD